VVYLSLLFILPSKLVVPGLGAAGRPAVMAGLGLFLWWAVSSLHPSLRVNRGQPVRWVLLLLVVSVLVAYVLGLDRGLTPAETRSADRYLLSLASWLGVALVAADGLRRREDVDRLLAWLVRLGAFSAALGALQFVNVDLTPYIQVPGLVYNQELVGLGQRGGPGFNRVYGTQEHYIEFGVVLAMLFPLAIHRLLQARGTGQALGRFIPVALIAGSIPFAVSRAGFLGLVVGFLVLSVAWTPAVRRRAFGLAIVGVIAFQAVVPGLLGTLRSGFVDADQDPSIAGRLEDYAQTASYLQDRPWFGRGPGTYIPEMYRILDNQFLGSLLEVGYFGTVALVTVFVATFALGRAARRYSADAEYAHLGQAIAALATVGFVCSFTFDSMSFPTSAGITMLGLGLGGALWRLATSPAAVQRPLAEAPAADASTRDASRDLAPSFVESSRPPRQDQSRWR
jgi:O-antigen ligase